MSLDAAFDPRLADGRQSAAALAIARGTGRLLCALGLACVRELTLPTGRRADLVGLGPSGELWIVEVKASRADLRADQKWPAYRLDCDRFFFACAVELDPALFPASAGLIVADGHGATLVREAPETRLAPARRRALTLRFATHAAARLHTLWDPGAVNPFGDLG